MRHGFLPQAIAIAAALACGGAIAQIRTDGTVGAAQALKGPDYVIPQTLGKLSGANLFHSFQTFGIGSSESATFTTSTPGIANVISRVTGGDVSQINGTLRLSAVDGAPAFFFINPAGVTFGKGAAIDVPGAFHAGTADYVKFGDGRLYADPQKASSFSSAPPEAFGFLGATRGLVAVKDGAVIVPRSGKALTLAGGDMLIDGAALAASGGGDLRVAAMGAASAEVATSGALPQGAGRLTMSNGGAVSVGSAGSAPGGKLMVSAGDVLMSGGSYLYSRGATHATDSGAGGDIEVSASGSLTMQGAANISSDTSGAGRAGAVRIKAGTVALDGDAYVYSSASSGTTGAVGAIDVAAVGALTLHNGSISSSAFGSGRAAAISISAGSMTADSGYVLGEGGGGSAPITVAVGGGLSLSNNGHIATSTVGSADAGAVAVKAGSLTLAGKAFIGSQAVQGNGNAGMVNVAVAGDAVVSGGSALLSTSDSHGAPAKVTVTAGTLLLDNGFVLTNSIGSATAPSGDVDIAVTGALTLRNAAAIDTSTVAIGNAGNVKVRARELTLASNSRIASSALESFGSAGALDVAVTGALAMQDGSTLSTNSSTVGNAGDVRVSAGSIRMDSAASIESSTLTDSLGRGGNVSVSTPGALVMRNESNISAATASIGNAGSVQVDAGSIALDTKGHITSAAAPGSIGNGGLISVRSSGDIGIAGSGFISSSAFGVGGGGDVNVQARTITLDSGGAISSTAYFGGIGNSGRIRLQTSGDLVVLNSSGELNAAGSVSTSTFSLGKGGAIDVQAANVRINGRGAGISSSAISGSLGDAGSVSVVTTGDVVVAGGGAISTSTGSLGNGGAVTVRADNVRIESGVISSSSGQGASGSAGSVDVKAASTLTVLNGGLSSSTFFTGAAGSVRAEAARVVIDGRDAGISAADGGGFSGQTGNVTVLASESIQLRNGGFVTIANHGQVGNPQTRVPSTLQLSAPVVSLQDAVVSASADGNVAASAIDVQAGRLTLDRSGITTSANTGNGGPIRVQGGDLATLRQSQITTSVSGVTGNGGDIDITTHALALDRGFIQANTAASGASGGLVRINVDTLVASGNTLLLGGNTAYTFRPDVPGFNVIQAAAPTGISGVVDVTSPVLDVTGSLRVLRGEVIDAGGLGRSLCQASGGSTLAQSGRGGLVASSRGLLRAEREGATPVAVAAVAPADVPGQPLFFGWTARQGYTPAPVHVASNARGCL